MQLQQFLDEKIVPALSLNRQDASWRAILDQSAAFAIWLKLKTFCVSNFASLSSVAGLCEILSFLTVALLFFILPAPQFADDKGVLALLVMAGFAFRILALLFSSRFNYKPNSLDAIVLGFVAINIIATAASEYLEPSLKGLSKMSVYFCAYFLFVGSLQVNPRNRSLIILGALLTAAFAVSLYGLYQYKIHVAPLATWEDPSIEDKTTRVYSTLKNPNLLAGYLVPLIPLSLAGAITTFCSKGWQRLLSIPFAICAAAITACSMFTGSRGGMIGIAAGLAAFGFCWANSTWQSKPKLRPFLILGVVLIIAGAIAAVFHNTSLLHRITSISSTEHSSNAYRMNVYRSSIQMFKDSWWLGIGPGNSTFKLAYGLYMKSGFDALGTYCVPLEVAVETGIVGLAIFLWMLVCASSRAHQFFWAQRQLPERWIAAGAASGLVAMLMHGLFDTVFYRPQVQFPFWLLLALCVCWSIPQQNKSDTGDGDIKILEA